jgi:hypothetical protein
MYQLPWKDVNENLVECIIEDLGVIYWIDKKEINSDGIPTYTCDLHFSNDSYNLTNKKTLKNDIDLKTAKDMAIYHFQKMLSNY